MEARHTQIGDRNTMRSIGRSLLTYGGYAVGGPWGAIVGGLLGTQMFPPIYDKNSAEQIEAISEMGFNPSMEGVKIAKVFGTCFVPGNYVWGGELTHTQIKKRF